MTTHAIIALQRELKQAEADHAEQVAQDRKTIDEGKRAEARVAARARTLTDLQEAVRVLEKRESDRQHPDARGGD